jgi:hypothetical protein
VNQKILAMEFVCDMWVPILKKSSKISASQKQVVKFSASPKLNFTTTALAAVYHSLVTLYLNLMPPSVVNLSVHYYR